MIDYSFKYVLGDASIVGEHDNTRTGEQYLLGDLDAHDLDPE